MIPRRRTEKSNDKPPPIHKNVDDMMVALGCTLDYYENTINKDILFAVVDSPVRTTGRKLNVKLIDGIKYVYLYNQKNKRNVWIKFDILKKIKTRKPNPT